MIPAAFGLLLAASLIPEVSANVPRAAKDEAPAPPSFAATRDSYACEKAGGGANFDIARACIRAGNYKRAERAALAAKDDTLSDPEVYETIAWAQLKQGKYGPAIENAETALTLDPDRARAYVLRAFGNELQGNKGGVLRDLESAVKRESRYRVLLKEARALRKVFRPAGWAASAGGSEDDAFVLRRRGEKELNDAGTPDAFFLDGDLPGAFGLPTLREALVMLSIFCMLSLAAGLLARRAWLARRQSGRPGSRPSGDVWDSVLEKLGLGLSRMEQRWKGPVPLASAASTGANVGPTPGQPLDSRGGFRTGGTPFKTSGAPAGQPAPGSPPHPGGAGSNDPRSKYEQVRVIGGNEDGVLWEGFDRRLQRAVAIEELPIPREGPRREAALARSRELAGLRHPAILDLYEIADLGDRLWLIFELLEGRTLRDRVAEAGRLGFEEAREIFTPVCEALEFAHGRGLMHRHVKPSRIILADAGYVKLTGFEVLLDMERGRRYLAPEAERGQPRLESDIFSLGVCLYEMLAGRPPFQDGDLEKKSRGEFARLSPLSLDAPPGIDTLIATALSPTPETRLRSARQFLEGMRSAESAVPPSGAAAQRLAKPAWWRRFRKSSRKRP